MLWSWYERVDNTPGHAANNDIEFAYHDYLKLATPCQDDRADSLLAQGQRPPHLSTRATEGKHRSKMSALPQELVGARCWQKPLWHVYLKVHTRISATLKMDLFICPGALSSTELLPEKFLQTKSPQLLPKTSHKQCGDERSS
ncbi:uncharacterized protein LOC135392960 [Ornithodoros turicata]|uniref:uncharacterized protein LOC135392960 n=1 Tax=Ornithodoros turicata TaxID=34597 RepID=UPI0031392CD3